MDEAYFGGRRKGRRGRGAAGKVPVFGILEREGQVFVEVVPNVRAQTVLGLAVKKVRRGSIVYTDRFADLRCAQPFKRIEVLTDMDGVLKISEEYANMGIVDIEAQVSNRAGEPLMNAVYLIGEIVVLGGDILR